MFELISIYLLIIYDIIPNINLNSMIIAMLLVLVPLSEASTYIISQ